MDRNIDLIVEAVISRCETPPLPESLPGEREHFRDLLERLVFLAVSEVGPEPDPSRSQIHGASRS